MSTKRGPEPTYYVTARRSGVQFVDGLENIPRDGVPVSADRVDPEIRDQGAEWLASLVIDEASLPQSVVRHERGDAPEQVALDMLIAAFSALNGVQAKDEADRRRMAAAQQGIVDAYAYISASRGLTGVA